MTTQPMLDEANYRVTLQLRRLGLYTPAVASIVTRLVPAGWLAYGWKHRGPTGEIQIPAVSLARLGELFGHPRVGLRDVLRHEFGHALVDIYPRMFRTASFRQAFGASIHSDLRWHYDPELFISPYAATNPEEDFCETFMVWLSTGGKGQKRFAPAIRDKMQFVEHLVAQLS